MKLFSFICDGGLRRFGPLTKSAQLGVAQVSNLLYRRFPIGRALPSPLRWVDRGVRRLEALRYSRLETCATTLSTALAITFIVAGANLLGLSLSAEDSVPWQ